MSEQILRPDGSQPPKHAAEIEERQQPDPAALVAAIMREMSEPKDGIAPTPVWLLLFFFVLAGMEWILHCTECGGLSRGHLQ